MTLSEEQNVMNPKETYELLDIEFKIFALKFSELPENTDRHLNEIRKMIHCQNENISKEKPLKRH